MARYRNNITHTLKTARITPMGGWRGGGLLKVRGQQNQMKYLTIMYLYSFVKSYIFLIFLSVGRKKFIVQYLAIIKYVIKRQNASRHEIFAAAVMAGDLPRLQLQWEPSKL